MGEKSIAEQQIMNKAYEISKKVNEICSDKHKEIKYKEGKENNEKGIIWR